MVNFRKLQTTWKIRIRKTGLSNTEFAEKLDTHLSHLSVLISSKANASVDMMQEIEDILAEHDQPFKPEYIEDGR